MAIGDSREEDQLIQERRAANEEFRNATRALNEASKKNLENSLRQELGLTRAGVRASLEDKLLGSGMKRTIYNFILDRRREKQLQKESGLTKQEFKSLKLAEKQRKKEIAQAKAREAQRKARDAALTATLGEEQAAIRIQALNAEQEAQILADRQTIDDAEPTTDDNATPEGGNGNDTLTAAANSITDEIEMMRVEQSGEGESPAERDKAKAEAKEASDKQIDLLQKIADNISGGGAGGGGEGEGSGGGLSGIGKTMASVGKGIGALGKGIGKGVGMALKGLAFGLKAFANPKILAGAAIFSGAIAIIGAGIAAATWILGKALPTFAEGMKSFEELDGDALLSAGKGMAAVAAGMAAFGVGTAVAGLGSLVGGISSGIASLFGGEDPLEKLAKFQEYNFDEPRISNNAKAMVSYSKGMAALGGASAVSGIGAAVGAIGGAIAGLFGADDPLDKMFEFQKYKFDTARIKDNAEAVSAYAEAMKDFPKSPSASIFKAAGDAIIGFLGGETDPFAPMIKFGTRKFNTEGIKTNALAVKAYAEAIKDFPESPSVSLLTSLKNGIIGFLGGETDPFAPMIRFSNLTFNTEGIVKNAAAVRAYAVAVKDFPESPSVGLFEGFKDAAISFLGGDTNPFTPIKTFGDMTLNIDGIRKNAGAVRAYANALRGLSIQAPPRSAVIGMRSMAMALGSGNSAGLSAFEKAMNSINGLDASKISLLQGIKIPEITPETAAEYEKVFNAMKKNQPDLIDKVSSTLSRFFGSSKKSESGGTGGTGGSGGLPAGSPSSASKEVAKANVSRDQKRINSYKAIIADPNATKKDKRLAKKKLRMLEQAKARVMSRDPATVGQGMAEDDVEGMEGAGMLGSAAKDVSTGGAVAKGKMMLTSAQQKKLARLRQRLKGAGKIMKRKIEKDIRSIERKGRAAYNKSVNPNRKKFSGDLTSTSRKMQAAAISSSPPAAAASAGGGGGNVSISAPTTNSNQSTSSYPITNRPNNPALDRIRNSLNF
jgi:hypothetical protein